MAFCSPSCQDEDFLVIPDNCQPLQLRRNNISQIEFLLCSVTLPDPLNGPAIEALYANGSIAVSSELANVVMQDPVYEAITVSSCRPPLQVVQTREMKFEDRIAITASTGSPALNNPWFDYDFWQDKLDKQLRTYTQTRYCNGDVVIHRNPDGRRMEATLTMFLNWQAAQNGGGLATEFKAGSLVYQGDPYALSTAKPAYNVAPDGTVTIY